MNIRPVRVSDIAALQTLLTRSTCMFGAQLARVWDLEHQVKESITAFSYGEGESASSYMFVAYENDTLLGMLELHTLIGYGINCLSYSRSKALHRSDILSVCHEQQVITLDQGLLGQHLLALCFVVNGQESIARELISTAHSFLVSEPDKFIGQLCISLPASNGENFWHATGYRFTGICYRNCNHHHAELIPQTPLYECFLEGALASIDEGDLLETQLGQWLQTQGFVSSCRLSAFDGSPILMRPLL